MSRKKVEYWVPIELSTNDVPRGPSERNRKIYDQVKVDRRSLRDDLPANARWIRSLTIE